MPISDSRARGFVGIRQSGGADLHGGGGRVFLVHEARLRDERAADAGLAYANCGGRSSRRQASHDQGLPNRLHSAVSRQAAPWR
jgi:hypothetical protein